MSNLHFSAVTIQFILYIYAYIYTHIAMFGFFFKIYFTYKNCGENASGTSVLHYILETGSQSPLRVAAN